MQTKEIFAAAMLADNPRVQRRFLQTIIEDWNSPEPCLSVDDVYYIINQPYAYSHEENSGFTIPWDFVLQNLIRFFIPQSYGEKVFNFSYERDRCYRPRNPELEKMMLELMKKEAINISNPGRAKAFFNMLSRILYFKLIQNPESSYTSGGGAVVPEQHWLNPIKNPRLKEVKMENVEKYLGIVLSAAQNILHLMDVSTARRFFYMALGLTMYGPEDVKAKGMEILRFFCWRVRNIQVITSIVEYGFSKKLRPLSVDLLDVQGHDFPYTEYIAVLKKLKAQTPKPDLKEAVSEVLKGYGEK